MEIKHPEQLSVVHNKGKIVKMYTTSKEALSYADEMEKINIHLSCDPLYNVLFRNHTNGCIEVIKKDGK